MHFRDDEIEVRKVGIGCYFTDNRENYILAQVLPNRVCMINLQSGNRRVEAVYVKDVTHLSREEFTKVCGEYASDMRMINPLI
jgi:hypothetical protein